MPESILNKYLREPFERFFRLESSSGIILFFAAVVAIVWANSPFGFLYSEILQYKIGFSTPTFELNKPLILWINDGLMAVFFFLIGLEIKRELLVGQFYSFRKAVFPIFGAIGGMAFPITIYLLLNQNPETARGWGIPMATDIAFSLAILKLLGKRIPIGLKVFLTAFAIIDDLGAVLTIAVFYSGDIQWMLILISLVIFAVLLILNRKGYYIKYLYFICAVVIWILFLKSGIHPTVAGVLMAFAIPIRRKAGTREFFNMIKETVDNLRRTDIPESDNSKRILTKEEIAILDNVEELTNKVQSPLQHLEHRLHGWVAYLILPLFALANAGVVFGDIEKIDFDLSYNLAIALIIGNVIGVTLISLLSVKLKIADLPEGVRYIHVFGVSFLAGIGFTMSIFIANLAFTDAELINSAKLGIIIGSAIAGLLGYIILRLTSKESPELQTE